MSNKIYPVSKQTAAHAKVNTDSYQQLYKQSIESRESNAQYWKQQASRLDWIKPFTKIRHTHWSKEEVEIKWFEDGVINVSENCIDRHLHNKAQQTAIIWEGDDPQQSLQ
ncbi:MAG: acetyl-coenzyme A synthetase, partial [Alcanivoracaceae bacterium]|nr:acetyl-coenzyme A synthetase [Alcanivoracaceae bacterium]